MSTQETGGTTTPRGEEEETTKGDTSRPADEAEGEPKETPQEEAKQQTTEGEDGSPPAKEQESAKESRGDTEAKSPKKKKTKKQDGGDAEQEHDKDEEEEGKDQPLSSSQYPYPTHDDILKHPYMLLSTKPRAPNACLLGRQKERTPRFQPGPGEYDPEKPRPSTHGLKMSSARTVRLTDKEMLDIPYYSPRLPAGRSTKIGLQHQEPKNRPTYPGPGQYGVQDTFRPQKVSQACTFGAPHHPKKPVAVPGPGAYDHDPVDGRKFRRVVERAGRGTAPVVSKKLTPIRTNPVPGPGSYDLGSTFSPRYGACFPTIKGRLAHPMDDRNAAHESAKTSTPRNGNRRMRASPRCV